MSFTVNITSLFEVTNVGKKTLKYYNINIIIHKMILKEGPSMQSTLF